MRLTARSVGAITLLAVSILGVYAVYLPGGTSMPVSSTSRQAASVIITEIATNATGSGGQLLVTPALRNLTSTTGSEISLDFRVIFTNGEEFNATSMLLQISLSTA